MKITVNGHIKDLSGPMTLSALILSICPEPKHVIAEVNETIIKAPAWETTPLKDGDHVELVTFVGGG
jgi:sulfur carrier protein